MRSIIYIILISILFVACSEKNYKAGATKYTSEARQRATMRNYTVRGKRYHPSYAEVGQITRGISSWYGPKFHGKQTSNGERYNMHKSTAAHKTLPMDTMLRVRNLQNGKSTVVRINDRGPFVSGRILDCSYKAGKDLGLDVVGIARVSIEVLGFAGKIEQYDRIVRKQKSYTPTRVMLSNFGLQVGAFSKIEGAKIYQRKYSRLSRHYRTIIKRLDNDDRGLYRVWIMGFGSMAEAEDFRRSNRINGALVIRD